MPLQTQSKVSDSKFNLPFKESLFDILIVEAGEGLLGNTKSNELESITLTRRLRVVF